jgi:hypothetical protein
MLAVAIAAIPLLVAAERARTHRWQCLLYASDYAEAAARYRGEARGNPTAIGLADWLDQVSGEFEAAAGRPWQAVPTIRSYEATAVGLPAGRAPDC